MNLKQCVKLYSVLHRFYSIICAKGLMDTTNTSGQLASRAWTEPNMPTANYGSTTCGDFRM